jgi:hypothetical protein
MASHPNETQRAASPGNDDLGHQIMEEIMLAIAKQKKAIKIMQRMIDNAEATFPHILLAFENSAQNAPCFDAKCAHLNGSGYAHLNDFHHLSLAMGVSDADIGWHLTHLQELVEAKKALCLKHCLYEHVWAIRQSLGYPE